VVAILPFLQDKSAFEPGIIHAMSVAFDDVCLALKVDGDVRARETIAVRIIDLAQRGEREPARLRDRMLREVGDEADSARTPDLRSMLSTDELRRRPSRPPDYLAENQALIALAQDMATSPEGILQRLADTALSLCLAHSAGLSLLEAGDQKSNFHWRAIAGQWAPHVNGGTPRDFGPCGTVLDQGVEMVCSHPELDFPYWAPIQPVLEEGLLIPFYIKGEAVGTIWVVAHDTSRRFDSEDLRVMNSLGTFAASAYQTLLSLNALRENEERFRALVDTSAQIVWTTDADGLVVEDSPSWRAFTGQTFDQWKGWGWTNALHPEDRDRLAKLWHAAVADSTPVDSEYRIRHVSGDWRWTSVRAVPLRNGDGVRGWVGMNRDITERKRSEEQITVLAREAEHRAKNVLATVQATVHLSKSDTPDGLKKVIEGRIQALANVHRLFVQSRWTGAELFSLITQELSPFCQDDESRVRINGPSLVLEPNTAQSIAVAIHELATNAAKYGALSALNGRIQVTWSRAEDGRLVLRWTETGGPPVEPPTHQGFGTRVMERMIQAQLKGEMLFDWRAEGLACEIVLPV
jgi:PAS domain S-box-containing protein